MNAQELNTLMIILVCAAATAGIRFLPFVLFSERTPGPVLYLGKVLPCAIMAMLVVYCLRETRLDQAPYGLPQAAAVLAVVLLHRWKHNSFLSIGAGTVLYMFLVQHL